MEMMAGKRITCCKMASDVVRLDRIKAKPKKKKKKAHMLWFDNNWLW